MLSYQRTSWSCSRGVISPHNSEGASKLLINQNLRFQEKTLPPFHRLSTSSLTRARRNVLIIARGWPLFTPPILSTTVHSRDSFLVLRAKISAKPMTTLLVLNRRSIHLSNRQSAYSAKRFEMERVTSPPLTMLIVIIATEASPFPPKSCDVIQRVRTCSASGWSLHHFWKGPILVHCIYIFFCFVFLSTRFLICFVVTLANSTPVTFKGVWCQSETKKTKKKPFLPVCFLHAPL